MPPPGYGSRETVGYPPSHCESDSLVQVGVNDGLCYKLCGCLPCFQNPSYEDTISANDPFASRYFMQHQAGDGSSLYSRDGSISSACPPANSNPAFQREYQQDDPELPPAESLGRIQFSISYDFQLSTLTLKIIKAVNLIAKDLGGTSDPYVKVMLLPDKKNKLCTKRKRKNLNPKWNEVFAFEGYPYNKLQNSSLFLQVLDYDRFSKDDPIGEVCISMSELDLSTGQTLWKNLQPSQRTGNLGQLYVSLCYDSVTSEIKITIVKAMHLKAKDINGLSDPYVKIWLMQDGKRTEKKKTTTRARNLNPIYNETLTFVVPLERIRSTSLSISVMDFDKMGRNEAIGQIVLGSKSGPLEVKHWTEMFSKPKQDVGQWHVLKDLS